jgi:hypothetical protein
MKLIVKARHHKITEFVVPLDDRQAVLDLKEKLQLKGASVHETMGPHWKNIYWINNRPLISNYDRWPQKKV